MIERFIAAEAIGKALDQRHPDYLQHANRWRRSFHPARSNGNLDQLFPLLRLRENLYWTCSGVFVCILRRVPLLFCHRFLPLRPSRRYSLVACRGALWLGCILLCPVVLASPSHHESELAFSRATGMQRRLDAKPCAARSRQDYERALNAYRAVYHGDPASPDAAPAIAAVADLLAGEGRCFRDAKLSHDAVAQWEFLRHQYPTSSLRQRALFEEGQIEQHDLHDQTAAKAMYRSFLLHYPQDPLAEQARARVARPCSGGSRRGSPANAATDRGAWGPGDLAWRDAGSQRNKRSARERPESGKIARSCTGYEAKELVATSNYFAKVVATGNYFTGCPILGGE